MEKCSTSPVPIQKGDKFSFTQCPRNDLKRKQMVAIPYASVVIASTMEAEFVACFEATIQANWLWNFISGLGIIDNIDRSLKMYCDNSATIFISKNDKYSKGVKHMELKYFAVVIPHF